MNNSLDMEKEKKNNLYVKDHQSIVSQEITQSLLKLVREETDGGMKMMQAGERVDVEVQEPVEENLVEGARAS